MRHLAFITLFSFTGDWSGISSNEDDPGRFGRLHHLLCALSYSDPVLEAHNSISRELPRSQKATPSTLRSRQYML